MKPTGIQFRIGLLFFAFAALIVIAVGATLWSIHTQRADARVINHAGRQRMLVHYMTRLALEYERARDPSLLVALHGAVNKFEMTHLALSRSSQSPNSQAIYQVLPGAANSQLIDTLEQVNHMWLDFKTHLLEVMNSQPGDQDLDSALSSVQILSYELIEHSERVVSIYEADSLAKVDRLYRVQFAFLGGAALLLIISGRLVYQALIAPIRCLGSAAERIGKGDLSTPVSVSGSLEINCLGTTLESMREQLLDSQSQLRVWGNTLEEKVAQRTRELEALSTVSREISSRLEISTVLQSITAKTCQLLSSEVALICLLEPGGDSLKLHATSGPRAAVSRISSQVTEGPVCQLLAGDKAVPCPAEGCHTFCGIVSHPFQASHVAAPLRVGSRVIGALCVGSSIPNAFSDESANLLMKMAYAAAVALENARLFERAEQTATLEERQRIAAEMHDGLAQTVSTLQMMVDLAKYQLEEGSIENAGITLQRGRAAIDQASSDIRHAIASLQEGFPVCLTLQNQISDMLKEFSDQKVRLNWDDNTISPLYLPPQVSEQLLRITREALLNAYRYSNAENILVRLEVAGGKGTIMVKDDGQGFDYGALLRGEGKNGKHFGLKIMRTRAARIAGCLDIHSTPRTGTCVTLSWPLPDTEQERMKNNEKVASC
jgi:two-component system, NarL family, nitrate/nitrite sensor histidine kinase NarX